MTTTCFSIGKQHGFRDWGQKLFRLRPVVSSSYRALSGDREGRPLATEEGASRKPDLELREQLACTLYISG